MKNFLTMEIYGESLIDESRAEKMILALSQFGDHWFMPERYDVKEPVAEVFDLAAVQAAVKWLAQPGGGFKFLRTKPFRVEGYIRDRRYRPIWTVDEGGKRIPVVRKFPEPHFKTQWVVWMAKEVIKIIGVEATVDFFKAMFTAAQAEYGFLTTESDHKSKNFVTVMTETGSISKFVGTEPDHGIPGLYWCNIFGKKYVRWMGNQILKAPADTMLLDNGAVMVRFSESPEGCETPEALQGQDRTMELIGREKFFDIKNPSSQQMTSIFGIQ